MPFVPEVAIFCPAMRRPIMAPKSVPPSPSEPPQHSPVALSRDITYFQGFSYRSEKFTLHLHLWL